MSRLTLIGCAVLVVLNAAVPLPLGMRLLAQLLAVPHAPLALNVHVLLTWERAELDAMYGAHAAARMAAVSIARFTTTVRRVDRARFVNDVRFANIFIFPLPSNSRVAGVRWDVWTQHAREDRFSG